MNPYIDEEDLLGFHVFVAELELLTGGRREAKYDEVAFLELLQKVLLSLDHTPVQVIKEYQRRCEQTLISLIRSGRCPEVPFLNPRNWILKVFSGSVLDLNLSVKILFCRRSFAFVFTSK